MTKLFLSEEKQNQIIQKKSGNGVSIMAKNETAGETESKPKRPNIEKLKFFPPVYNGIKLIRDYFIFLDSCVISNAISRQYLNDRRFIKQKLNNYDAWTKYFKYRMNAKWSGELKSVVSIDLKEAKRLEKKYCSH